METKKINKTILCYDNGLFFEFALKLTDYYEKVLYFCPWKNSFPRMAEAMLGTEWVKGERLNTFDGKNIERVDHIFDHIDKIDLACFLDVYDGDLQVFLEDYGVPIFGSRKGEDLELERWETKQKFKKIGMDVQPIVRIVGLENLKNYLKDKENKYIKISKYRKEFETFKHCNSKLSEPIFDKLHDKLGPMKSITEFIVEDEIDAIVEEGVDAYTIDGEFPNKLLSGVEIKDCGYFCEFMNYEDLSKGNKKVNEQMKPLLKEYGYKGFISSEIRTTEGGKNYAIDPCCRLGSPPSELYQEMYSNLGDIIDFGSTGKMIDPESRAKFGLEVIIHSSWYTESHQAVYFPEEYRDNIKLRFPLKVDGTYYCLNLFDLPEIGAIVVYGDSFEECKKKMMEIASKVEGHGIEIKLDSIDQAYEEFNKMKKLK